MHLFKSREPNLVHYVTSVTYDRVPVFRNDHVCSLVIDALSITRLKEPFRLIGYVIMPDHFHMLANPLGLDISVVTGRFKGRSASAILKWLRAENHEVSLAKLKLPATRQSGQTHAVWLKEFAAVDIWSHKFIRQKLNYIHLNLYVPGYASIRRSGDGRAITLIFRIEAARYQLKLIKDGCGQ